MTSEEAKTVLQWVYETYFKPTYIPHSLTPNALAIEDAFNMAIKALEQEPKTGHWEYDNTFHYCSRCGERAIVSNWKSRLSHYCPNCGAKMVELQES